MLINSNLLQWSQFWTWTWRHFKLTRQNPSLGQKSNRSFKGSFYSFSLLPSEHMMFPLNILILNSSPPPKNHPHRSPYIYVFSVPPKEWTPCSQGQTRQVPRLTSCGSQAGDQCLWKGGIFLFRLAQLRIGYGWWSMAHIWNWTHLRKPLSTAQPLIHSLSALLVLILGRLQCASNFAAPPISFATIFHHWFLSKLDWISLQIGGHWSPDPLPKGSGSENLTRLPLTCLMRLQPGWKWDGSLLPGVPGADAWRARGEIFSLFFCDFVCLVIYVFFV